MTLPLYLLPAGALDSARVGDTVELVGAEARHAVTVRRTRAGERIQLADGEGVVIEGDVIDDADTDTERTERAAPERNDARAQGVRLLVRVTSRTVLPEPSPRFVLVQALAKNDRDDQAIEAATELGVDEVVPWQAERSVVQWRGERGEKARRKWDAVLVAATKQSRRPRRPLLAPTMTTRELAARIEAGGTAYLLHEEATTPLAGVELPTQGDVLVIVGPEGGVAPGEVELLERAGASTVRLGSTVLRSSSAGPAALALLNGQARWR